MVFNTQLMWNKPCGEHCFGINNTVFTHLSQKKRWTIKRSIFHHETSSFMSRRLKGFQSHGLCHIDVTLLLGFWGFWDIWMYVYWDIWLYIYFEFLFVSIYCFCLLRALRLVYSEKCGLEYNYKLNFTAHDSYHGLAKTSGQKAVWIPG